MGKSDPLASSLHCPFLLTWASVSAHTTDTFHPTPPPEPAPQLLNRTPLCVFRKNKNKLKNMESGGAG